jgi:protease secretion system outer membrane protein
MNRLICIVAWQLTAFLVIVCDVHAISLKEAYESALRNDPYLRISHLENESVREDYIVARAAILPNISGNVNLGNNLVHQNSSFGDSVISSSPHYRSRTSSVELRLPILNIDGLLRIKQGRIQINQFEKLLEASENDLGLRVVSSYFDAVFALKQLQLSKVQLNMYEEQWKANRNLFKNGESTKTDLLETESRYQLAEAQVIEAEDSAVLAKNALEILVGHDPGHLESFEGTLNFDEVSTIEYAVWEANTRSNNRALISARLGVDSARLEIARIRSAHLPRLDMVMGYSKGANESINTYGQATTNRSIGLQLNIPIYSGGAMSARTRQAILIFQRIESEYQTKVDGILMALRKEYNVVHSSEKRIFALTTAVATSEQYLKAIEKSIVGGVRVNVDMLNAVQQIYTAKRDLAQAQYAFLLAKIRLKAATKKIGLADIQDLSQGFEDR